MLALASETVSRRVSRLPFQRNNVLVTTELIGIVMECLNAECTKTLPLRVPSGAANTSVEALDRCLEARLRINGKTVVPVIAGVLCSAGIAETTEITDRISHRLLRGIRLLPPWIWHGFSQTAPVISSAMPMNGEGGDPSSWTSMCPVCRTGIITRVTGKQLFGIPWTDFYMECMYCGAKFIPVGGQFRLVSIARIRDPLWKKHLDQTLPAESWAAIARGTGKTGNTHTDMAGKKTVRLPAQSVDGGLMHLKDGSLTVPSGKKTLYFKPVKLQFSGGMKENVFARAQKPLRDVLENPAFSHLVPVVNARYSRYLPLKSGIFLSQLKERRDPLYREFLNNYGDEKFCTFRMEGPGDGDKNGVLIVVAGGRIYHALECNATFRATINDSFGRISPEDCFLNRDSTRCRINALLSNNRKDGLIYIYTCEKEEEQLEISEKLKESIASGV